jgi:hypothetical protein
LQNRQIHQSVFYLLSGTRIAKSYHKYWLVKLLSEAKSISISDVPGPAPTITATFLCDISLVKYRLLNNFGAIENAIVILLNMKASSKI